VFLGCWSALLLAGRSRLLRDPGTFWHTLTGDRILTVGLPRTDWLSFTFANHPWIAHQWLGECLMSAVHRAGGLDALVVVTSGGLALLMAWLFHRSTAVGLHPLRAALLVGLCFLASSLHFHARPHVLSILFFAWLYARLIDFEERRLGLVALIVAWPAFVVWVNCHGAVIGGLATFALVVAVWISCFVAGRPSPIRSSREAVCLIALLAACVGTVFVNPYGVEMPRAWAAILRSRVLPQAIVEHGSLLRSRAWQVLLLAGVYVIVLLRSDRRALRVSSLVPLVWMSLTLARVRHAPFFAVAATLALAELLPRSSMFAGRGERTPEPMRGLARRQPFPRVCALALGGAVVFVAIAHRAVPGCELVARLDPGYWPVDLIGRLRAAERELPVGAPVLNDMLFGGFIAYHAPGLRLFVDDRWELYGDEFMAAESLGDTAWLEAWASRSGARLAMAAHGSPLQAYLQRGAGWRLVASSPAAVLYRRDLREAAGPALEYSR
jgi:hypothetical protein